MVCVGLDPDYRKLPDFIKKVYVDPGEAIFAFNRAIIDATKHVAGAYKLQSAYYEAWGESGITAMADTNQYLRDIAAAVPVILDAKRGDIGATNEGYVEAIFGSMGFDAVTLHPYLGGEALQPFLEHGDKGIIILCRTSNPGSGEFQDLQDADGVPLYIKVAKRVAESWNAHGNCVLVVGATYPKEAREIRQAVGEDIPFLIPGIGAQGGYVQTAVEASRNLQGEGIIINSSRAIIFASSGEDFAEAAKREAESLNEQINCHRRE